MDSKLVEQMLKVIDQMRRAEEGILDGVTISILRWRIEQLERELALERHKMTESEKLWIATSQAACDQLAAEKALADRLRMAGNSIGVSNIPWREADEAYRKARGL